jgi:glutathione S-transferase
MSTRPLLYIGNKKRSSWSLRPWLALAASGVPFDEEMIALDLPDTRAKIAAVSPGGKVPVLVHGSVTVWESLAICEYAAETWPEAQLWPSEPSARAHARAVSAEMHSGFAALRQECPMATLETRSVTLSDDARANVKRIQELWADCRARHEARGPYLFGAFSIADAMYAPVVTRFSTYAVDVSVETRRYMDTIWAMPAMQRWKDGALLER